MKKRKSFRGVFIRRLFVVVFVAALVYVMGMAFFANAKKEEKKELYYQGQNILTKNIHSIAADLEGTQFTNYARFNVAMVADAYGVMSLLCDADTRERIAGCEEKIFLIQPKEDGTGNSILVCDTESIPGWEEYRKEALKQKEEGHYITVSERHIRENAEDFLVYTDGTHFIPKTLKLELSGLRGMNEWIYDGNMIPLLTKNFDMPQGCPEGYVEEDTANYGIRSLLFLGYSKSSPYMNVLECGEESYQRLMEYYEATKSDDKQSPIMMFVSDSFLTFSLLSETELQLGADKSYTLITSTYYDVWEIYRGLFISVAVALLIVSTLLAFVLAKLSYTHLKAGYDMEDYRKNLMNTMAHDLKSPLMSISGYAENLRNNVYSEKKEYYADAIMDNVQYMNHMIESILNLSKTEETKVVLHKEKLEAKALLEEILKKQELWIQEKTIAVQIEGQLIVEADPTLFTQALSNLVDNAVKFSPKDSSIHMILKEDSIRIANPCEEDLSGVLDTLCEPFKVGDMSRGNRKGNGLGLAIVKNICELHGFLLHLENKGGIFEAQIKVREK